MNRNEKLEAKRLSVEANFEKQKQPKVEAKAKAKVDSLLKEQSHFLIDHKSDRPKEIQHLKSGQPF